MGFTYRHCYQEGRKYSDVHRLPGGQLVDVTYEFPHATHGLSIVRVSWYAVVSLSRQLQWILGGTYYWSW